MDAQEMKDFRATADQLGKAAADLKEVNEQTGKTVSEVKTGLDKVNERIDGIEGKMTSMREAEAKNNRPAFGGVAGEADEYKQEFVAGFMRKGREDGLQEKAGSLSVDADGGFAVPEDVDSNILTLLRDESVMRQECKVIQVGSEEYKKLVNLGGAAAGWVGETAARPDTATPSLAKIAPIFGELYANPQATQRMLDDAMFDVEQWYQDEVIIEFGEAENTAFTVGDGSGKPKGFLAHTHTTESDSERSFGSLQKIISGAVGSFTGDDLLKLIYATKKKYRDGAKFMMSNDSLLQARLLKDTDGNYLWKAGLEMGQPSTLLGYGISENEDMPDVANGALSLSFGNFQRGYTIVDVRGVTMLRDALTNKPYVGFYSTKRVGGMLEDSNAIKSLEIAAA